MIDSTATKDVRAIAGLLGGVFAPVDREVVSAGGRLAAAVQTFSDITDSFEALPRALDAAEVGRASDALAEVSVQLLAMARGLSHEREGMTALLGLHGRVGRNIQRLRETVGAISILAVNSHITAAGITSSTEDLTGFTQDITTLVSTAEEAVKGYRREQLAVGELLHKAAARQAEFERKYGAMLRAVGARIDSSLADMSVRRSRTAAAAVQIRDRSRKISADIGVVVMALQVGDMTRQRLEHVTHALAVLDRGLAPGSAEAWRENLTEAEETAIVEALTGMQSAQLADTARAFASELDRIMSALAALGDDARALVGVGTETYGEGGEGGASFLAGLERNLAEAAMLLSKCREARLEVDAALSGIGSKLRALLQQVGSVRDVEIDMRLVGLNATFKCSRLGEEGRTLSTIAQELRSYANQTVECADALISALERTLAAAEGLDREHGAEGAGRIETIGRSMAEALEVLRGTGDQMDRALGFLQQQGESVGGTLAEMACGMPAASALAPVLHAEAERLAAVAARHAGGAIAAAALSERLGLFGGRGYTMASEREIHQRFAGLDGGAAEEAKPADDLEDILF